MRAFVILLLAAGPFLDPLVDPFLDDGERDGRRGNRFYLEEAYEDAAEAYSSGLAVLSETADVRLRYGLNNNLGAALLKSGDVQAASQAFGRALAIAEADADLARTAYNAGNAAFAGDDLRAAVEHYRTSLLRDPDNEDAKFNYELARRKLDEQENQEQQQQGGSQEPQEDEQQQDQQSQGEQGEEGRQDQPQNGDQQQQQDGEPQDQQNSEQPQPSDGNELSDAQAERILQALQNDEEQLLRQVQRPTGRPRRVEKDW